MALKIKCNDDRVRAATTAILLISRDRLSRGETENLVESALAIFRGDPKSYKENKAIWANAKEFGSLVQPAHIAYFKNLTLAIEALLKKWTQAKRQFNSLRELDNALVAQLKGVEERID